MLLVDELHSERLRKVSIILRQTWDGVRFQCGENGGSDVEVMEERLQAVEVATDPCESRRVSALVKGGEGKRARGKVMDREKRTYERDGEHRKTPARSYPRCSQLRLALSPSKRHLTRRRT
jgi:hypothetical protein